MRKIIVDTNIVFSCLLNSHGTIGDLIFNSDGVFDFYGNQDMKFEVRKHWNKLKKASKLTDVEIETTYEIMLIRLTFINEELIPQKIWEASELIVTGIDPDDMPFVVLTKYLKGALWTGDKILCEGLKAKHSLKVYNTQDLTKLRNRLIK